MIGDTMKFQEHSWFDEFPGAITVCDTDGIILEMNDVAAEDVFKDDGGRDLIGKNLLDCHPEPARRKLERMMDKQETNVYTIEKKGKKKLIYQTPWYKDGVYAGFIELSLEIPFDMPHFVRD
jgi:transcriptional regulator with PAS, ATPase and Fis domain